LTKYNNLHRFSFCSNSTLFIICSFFYLHKHQCSYYEK
jgi:hypothetical protein